jgi:hypothetical protein
MEFSEREFWTTIHGFLGAGFLLAFSGGVLGIWSLSAEAVSVPQIRRNHALVLASLWGMAALAWAAAVIGTYVVFPWYRTGPPPGVADLSPYPSYLLLSDPDTALYHKIGMEFKENWGWIVPILATTVAFIATYYRTRLAEEASMRYFVLALFLLSFGIASIVGLFGVLVSKAAPVQ